MMRKTMIGLMAAASVSILMVDAASARGGFHGGFGGGGGVRWGGGGGGFRTIGLGGGFRPMGVGGVRAAAIGAPGFRNAAFVGARYGYRPYYRYGRGFPFVATAVGLGLGYGLYGSYGYDDDYGYGYPYYDGYGYGFDNAYYGGGCYVVQQRVMTAYGWQLSPVQVCN